MSSAALLAFFLVYSGFLAYYLTELSAVVTTPMSRSLVPGPAGLSSDTLEQSPTSPARVVHENEHEQWSDAHDTLETDDERDAVEEIAQPQGDLTIRPPKAVTTPDNVKTHEMHTPSPTASSLPQPQGISSQETEEGSVRSLPIVQVTEPSSPVTMNTRSAREAPAVSPTASLAPTTNSSLDRRSTLRAQEVSICFSQAITWR